MVEGKEEDSEEEHDVLRTYMEIYDDNFDYEFFDYSRPYSTTICLST